MQLGMVDSKSPPLLYCLVLRRGTGVWQLWELLRDRGTGRERGRERDREGEIERGRESERERGIERERREEGRQGEREGEKEGGRGLVRDSHFPNKCTLTSTAYN